MLHTRLIFFNLRSRLRDEVGVHFVLCEDVQWVRADGGGGMGGGDVGEAPVGGSVPFWDPDDGAGRVCDEVVYDGGDAGVGDVVDVGGWIGSVG